MLYESYHLDCQFRFVGIQPLIVGTDKEQDVDVDAQGHKGVKARWLLPLTSQGIKLIGQSSQFLTVVFDSSPNMPSTASPLPTSNSHGFAL